MFEMRSLQALGSSQIYNAASENQESFNKFVETAFIA
jgi:hypothetical protein